MNSRKGMHGEQGLSFLESCPPLIIRSGGGNMESLAKMGLRLASGKEAYFYDQIYL